MAVQDAIYHVDNGQDGFDEIHFKTKLAQVFMDTGDTLDKFINVSNDSHGNGKQALTLNLNGKKVQLGDTFHAFDSNVDLGTQYIPWKDLFLKGVSWNNHGYTKLPNEFILQFGNSDIAPNSESSTITFPVAFPNKCLVVLPANVFAFSRNVNISVGGQNLRTFNCFACVGNTGDTPTFHVNFNWIAIGY